MRIERWALPFIGELQLGSVLILDATSPHAGPAPGEGRRIGDTMHGHACACVHMPTHMWRQSCICRDLRHGAAACKRSGTHTYFADPGPQWWHSRKPSWSASRAEHGRGDEGEPRRATYLQKSSAGTSRRRRRKKRRSLHGGALMG